MAPTNLRLVQALGTKLFTTRSQLLRSTTSAVRAFSADHGETSSIHFRATNTPHPLATKGNTLKVTRPTPTISGFDKDGNIETEVTDAYITGPRHHTVSHFLIIFNTSTFTQPYGQILGDHTGLLQNHIWREEELQEKLSTLYHHKPKTFVDHLMQKTVRSFFNFDNFL